MFDVVVTRHKALVEFFRNKDLISSEAVIIEHATLEDVENKNVLGILPLRLASYAQTVAELEMDLSQEQRGRELTLEEVEKAAGDLMVYKVFVLERYQL